MVWACFQNGRWKDYKTGDGMETQKWPEAERRAADDVAEDGRGRPRANGYNLGRGGATGKGSKGLEGVVCPTQRELTNGGEEEEEEEESPQTRSLDFVCRGSNGLRMGTTGVPYSLNWILCQTPRLIPASYA